ncbi:phosphotransferase [Ornithinimicrobium cryptoxanthini]|uniref:phosphotransferase n=1 Tax=Ornithinimicrobium cryptoxanthini TaxID=2934161 RepID=UPI00211944E8|nr:phosphotransferase [Ornithinimicrobium cryptoxanthini]
MIRSDLALAALATAAVPGMRPVSVAAIRSGDDNPLHQTALVEDVTGRKWVVRSPLGAAGGAELELNDELTRQLGKHLPFKVPAAAGYADIGADGRAAVYPYVEGLALSLRHLPTGPGLASAVGRAIAAVHNIPRELFEEHSVPVFDAAQFRARKLAELDRAAETGHVPNGLLARWEQALDAAAMWQFVTTPVHGSLDGSSFLVAFSEDDAASGRVVGLTGWDRAQIADPAEDFARLVERANPRAVDAVFESYSLARSQRPDGYLLHRARLASEMRRLNGLVAAVGAEDEDFVRIRADELRKMDRLTANDDSLVPRTALVPPVPPTSGTIEESSSIGEGSTIGEGAADPKDGSDATAPVPGVTQDSGGHDGGAQDDDEPAFVVEQPSDGSHLEPVQPHAAQDGPTVSPADVTAPIPMFRPVDRAPDEPASGDADTVAQDTAETQADEGSVNAGSVNEETRDAAPADEAHVDEAPALEDMVDKSPASETPVVDDTVAKAPVDEERQDATAPAAYDDETSADDDQPPADDQPGEAVEDDDEAVKDNDEAIEDDDEADERMHTLYGMPEAADVDPWESGKR